MTRLLIVAFDGLDYELIKKYNCRNIMQNEFGKIDNTTGMKTRITSELFASFITGKTWKEHGVIGLRKITNKFLDYLEHKLNKIPLFHRMEGIRCRLLNALYPLKIFCRVYNKSDLKCKAIFDEIPNSKALFVPSYNPEPVFALGNIVQVIPIFGVNTFLEVIEKEQFWREHVLFEELKKRYNLIMVHFHYPDWIQHLFGAPVRVEEKLREMYKRMDKLAGKIIKEAKKNGYDWILFMSDHGLPENFKGGEHNKNAFYSSNIKLGLRNPKITDFHDIILQKFSSSNIKELNKRIKKIKSKLSKIKQKR